MSFRYSLCNEVLGDYDFAEQCRLASLLGYKGLEIAPYTLDIEPQRISSQKINELKSIAASNDVEITGLHWLLVKPEGLSITTGDKRVHQKTVDVMCSLIDLCAELGGKVLVHGSPHQRRLDSENPQKSREQAESAFHIAAEAATRAGVVYCLEPLAQNETNFINTVAEATALVEKIDLAGFKTMIDTSAAGQTENDKVATLIRRWVPAGNIAHIQLNDRNRRGPGQGQDHFGEVLAALRDTNYAGFIAIEPFIYEPDGLSTAARVIGYLQGLEENAQ